MKAAKRLAPSYLAATITGIFISCGHLALIFTLWSPLIAEYSQTLIKAKSGSIASGIIIGFLCLILISVTTVAWVRFMRKIEQQKYCNTPIILSLTIFLILGASSAAIYGLYCLATTTNLASITQLTEAGVIASLGSISTIIIAWLGMEISSIILPKITIEDDKPKAYMMHTTKEAPDKQGDTAEPIGEAGFALHGDGQHSATI